MPTDSVADYNFSLKQKGGQKSSTSIVKDEIQLNLTTHVMVMYIFSAETYKTFKNLNSQILSLGPHGFWTQSMTEYPSNVNGFRIGVHYPIDLNFHFINNKKKSTNLFFRYIHLIKSPTFRKIHSNIPDGIRKPIMRA